MVKSPLEYFEGQNFDATAPQDQAVSDSEQAFIQKYMGLDVGEIVHDIAKRPFILVGTLALLLLAVLAATSPHRAIRWLGAARWRALHRSVYVVAVLGILHFFWMRAGKNDFAEVLGYGALLAGLLGWRIRHGWRQRHKKYHPMP